MHDLRWIREHPEEFDRGLTRRGLSKHAEKILELDRSWRAAETRAQEAQAERNRRAREFGAARRRAAGAIGGELVEFGPLGAQTRSRQAEAEAAAEAKRRRTQIDDILA